MTAAAEEVPAPRPTPTPSTTAAATPHSAARPARTSCPWLVPPSRPAQPEGAPTPEPSDERMISGASERHPGHVAPAGLASHRPPRLGMHHRRSAGDGRRQGVDRRTRRAAARRSGRSPSRTGTGC